MTKRLTVRVSAEELEQLFQALHIWEKIKDGRLDTEEISRTSADSTAYPGATSIILKHHNSMGLHVATTHRIHHPHHGTLHWDGSNLYIGNVVYYR